MTRAAIVILNWNGLHFLQKFMPVLVEKTSLPDVEIIVADNASDDDSVGYLKKDFKEVRIIEFEENHGFAGGYNKALEQVEAEYFLLLNSDIEVSDGWLEPLLDLMDRNKHVAACSPLLLDQLRREKYEYAGAAGGYMDRFGYTFCRGRIFDRMETADNPPKEPLEVGWTTGACMLIRSGVFRDAGGFDAHFFAHMEEVDLCWRLRNMGHKLAIVPASRVYHVGGGTLPKSNPFKTYLNFRNNLLLLYKNLPEKGLWRRIFTRKMMDGLSAALFLVQFKFRDIAAIRKAHRDARKDLKRYGEFRKQQAIMHGYPGLTDIYQRSVVVDYFLLGRKTFSRLRNGFADKMNERIIEKDG